MELKLACLLVGIVQSGSSNCTFMELKYGKYTKVALHSTVLIVPLWN